MQAANDVTIDGRAFAAAVRSILPRSPKKDLGGITIASAGAGTVELAAFFASAKVTAEGTWTYTVEVSGRFLRGIVTGDPPPAFRLVFFGGMLSLNTTTITAQRIEPEGGARSPAYVPTNRLGVPQRRGGRTGRR